ncbi:hypothetical protein ONZ45_g1303 [Pleurotus djamor]|nr:hypothetical protein ONZ45_g1303 [Pleurotus djamor]
MMSPSTSSEKSLDKNAYQISSTRQSGIEATQDAILLERKLVRKVDCRMSILIIMYILCFMARSNPSAARLNGFESDLHLQGSEFATVLSMYYVGYIIMQIPSNMFLNWIGKPSLYLPVCMILWSMISILTGITQGFTSALITRFFLGFAEASFFPGATFLLSKWYTGKEIGLRMAILNFGVIISIAFMSLIASGILNSMEGTLGRAAWRWLFYIEGSLGIFVAIIALFVLPDFPATTSWLSHEERQLAIRRMEDDAGLGVREEPSPRGMGLWSAVTDWKVWWLALSMTSLDVMLSFSAYFPTLTATLGFSPTVSLFLCAPPFIFAAIFSFLWSRRSDRMGERFFHMSIPLGISILGFILSMSTMNKVVRYASLFLMAQSWASVGISFAWASNSFMHPSAKRAVALAMLNTVCQLGDIAGSYAWPTAWAPAYRASFGICAVTAGCTIIMCWVFRLHLASLNKKMEEDEKIKGLPRGFRYML